MISQETVDRVKSRMNAIRIIGEYVKLERRGRSHIGLCPFHKEKTPSFHVSDERNFYHCFGCGVSGDPIRFLMEHEGLSFVEAIRHIAEHEGIEVVETGDDRDRRQAAEQRRRLEEMYDAGALAAAFYERMLREHPLAELARDEIRKRGLEPDQQSGDTIEAMRAFRVGYAPYGWDNLARQLRDQGASVHPAERVGLLVPRKTGPGHYDRFRHRLMFAVLDLRGRVVAFSGRALPEPSEEQLAGAGLSPLGTGNSDAPAKYLNSPESPIYRKREVLFGLYQARQAVRERDQCILVEGNFDVVSLHARGVTNVVAPLGTAFTAEQGKEIRRYTNQAVLLFDGDSAGRRATESSRGPAREVGLVVRVASLPEGVDPDDLARQGGAEAIRRIVGASQSMLEYLIESTLDEKVSGALDKAERIKRVKQLLEEEDDPTVRAMAKSYADTVAERLGIADGATLRALEASVGVERSGAPPQAAYARARREGAEEPRQERQGGLDPLSQRPRGPAPPQPPERAKSRNQAHEIEREIFGAFLDFPSLLGDAVSWEAANLLEGDLALGYVALRHVWESVGQTHTALEGASTRTGVDPGRILEALPDSLGGYASQRLAAPKHDQLDPCRGELVANLRRLEKLQAVREAAHVVDELHQAQAQGDFEQELSLLSERFRRARERRR
ncbi:MAG: DNA primase [Polyangiaceae bacterium]